MDLDKILEMLGVQKLDESAQKEIKDKLKDIVEVKVKEDVQTALVTEKEKLVEEYEGKFEEYKKDITSKFSNFVDSVLDEELSIPENIVEYARKGELYEELIKQFKIRLAIDEGLLDEEVKNLLKEAKEEIISLRGELDKTISEKLEIEIDAQKLSSNLYLRKKCDGLTESQKIRVMNILGDLTDKEEIDRKYPLVVETAIVEAEGDEPNECVCPECGAVASVKGTCSEEDCPECGKKMKDSEKESKKESKDSKDGKGLTEVKEVKEEKDAVNEDSPFKEAKNMFVKILKENKF